MSDFKIIECPRDAMQGIEHFIDTETKAEYINKLLEVGFHTIDFGSFVSPKAVPQMRDTAEVLKNLEIEVSESKLLAIIANERGARDACSFPEIKYLGYPFSISETFQQRNTNKSVVEALNDLENIQKLCIESGKELVVYISMGFGNPYGDPYNEDIVNQFISIMQSLGIGIVSIADTVGLAEPKLIESVLSKAISAFPTLEIGAHLHSRPENVFLAISAAYKAGAKRIDGALLGYGGCPMAEDDLVGNLATESIVSYLEKEGVKLNLNLQALEEARTLASNVFA